MRGGEESGLLGRWGEERTADYLRKQGCVIEAARWRCRLGELDLVASDGKFLRFVEVKLRKSAAFGTAGEAVNAGKQKRLRLAASLYLSRNPTALQPRFDVAEVYAPQGTATRQPVIRYIEDAFC